MNPEQFQQALDIINGNTGSKSVIEVGTDAADGKKHLTIKECNATITGRLVKAGFSLFVSEKGVAVDKFS